MKDKIVFNWRFLRNYIIFESILIILFFLLLAYVYDIPYYIAFADSLISVALLGFMLLSLKFVVKFARSKSITSFSSIRNSIIAIIILVFIWTSLLGHALKLLFSDNYQYIEFLTDSLLLRFIAGLFFAGIMYLSFFLILYQTTVKKSLKVEHDLRILIQKTQLQALKNQLNPHFIFNSLNSISSLTLSSPEKSREMLVMLSDFLRIALRQDAMQKVNLEQELDYIKLYLQIEKVRFEEKLSWEFRIAPDHFSCKVPVLILQPLFENAVKHGIQQSHNPGSIKLTSKSNNNCLELCIQNTYDTAFQKFSGEGVGLENVRNRLGIIYQGAASLKIQVQGDIFEAILCIPLQSLSTSENN